MRTPTTESPGSSNRPKLWLVPFFALTAVSAFAQATAPQPADAAVEETVMLSPFEVRTERDRGYYSPNTLSGGRTNTALKDTPSALTVLNRQFLDDIAANDIYQAEIWTVNASPTYNPINAVTGSNNRGPNYSFFSRNYFLWYTKSDTFSTERFEFGRGPNGVLFGDGNIGGLASTMTKQAYLGRRAISLSTRVDSWGGYRSTADISIPAGERVALRLNLLNDRGTMWQDNSNQFRDGAHLAGTVKLTDKTYFRFEGEVGDIDRQIYVVNYNDGASYWDRTTVYNGVTAPSTATGGPGVARVSSLASWFVDVPGTPGAGYANWATFYRTTGSGLAIRDYVRSDGPVGVPVLQDRAFNIEPPSARFGLKYATSTFYLEHRFSDDLFAQFAFNSARTPYEPKVMQDQLNQYYIDVNTVLPTGAPNPNFGKVYSELALNKSRQMNTVSEFRGFVAYRFDTRWWKGNVNLIGGSRFDKFDLSRKTLAQTNGENPNVTAPENEYHLRVYWENPIDIREPNIPGRTFDYVKYSNLIIQRKFIDYAQLATVNKFFHDRLTVLLGGRMDHVYQTQRIWLRNDPTTGQPVLGANIIPEGQKNAVAVPGAKSLVDKTVFSKNGGLVYYVRPWVGVYYNYSQTFATPDSGNNLIDGSEPGISHSESNEVGLKLNLLGDKIYADVRYYDSKQTDALTTTGAAAQINTIWTQLGRTDLNTLAYRDTQSLALNGYELEVVANPTRNWRVIANFTKPTDQRNVNALPGLRKYYAEHVAEWQAAAANNTIIATNLTSIETVLANNRTFALANGFTKYRANFYATYSFPTGWLRGFVAGGGINYVGPTKVGNAASAFDYRYSDVFYLLSGHVSYTTDLGKTKLKLQLNVNNILDERDPVATSFATYREKGVAANPTYYVPNAYRYNDPRQFILSATLSF